MVLTQSKANDVGINVCNLSGNEVDNFKHIRGITKRYHLTEFRSPYIPDQDREELPYSMLCTKFLKEELTNERLSGILFDFLDGRTLQCACEDALSQARLLQSKHPWRNV